MNKQYPIDQKQDMFWLEVLIMLLGIAGVIIFLTYYDQALPSAAIDLRYSRDEIQDLAENELQELGLLSEEYQFALSFNEDRMAAYYLQRTLGVEETNIRLANEKLPLHFWMARWYKPQEKEEYRIHISPQGDFLGFDHIIAEDAQGAAISLERAQTIAENFLKDNLNWNTTEWEQIEASSATMPSGRIDHTFVYKSRYFSAGESELRYSVVIKGDEIGYLRYWVKIPESFSRDFSSERDRAGFITSIAMLLGLGGFLMVSVAGFSVAKPDFRRILRPALLAALVSLVSALNFLPLYKASYETTQDYTLFWVMVVIGALFSAFFYSAQVFLGWGGGQGIAKLVWQNEDRILARGPHRWIEFSRSAWRGLMLGGFNLGYVVVFYLFATKILGWWSPVTADYSDAYATPFPFLLAFNIGLNAALTEELLFRLIGISIFLWMFRKQRWLAVLIPGVLWAFAHTNYVSYPIYARGVELTIHAIVMGIIFLKFDLFTTIMAHFTYNMIVVSMPLLRSNDPYFQFSGIVVLAVLAMPLLPGLYWTLKLRLGKSETLPNLLTLSPATKDDLQNLAAFPVTADWGTLIQQSNRVTLCLRDENNLIGFSTGFIENNTATIDGIYISPRWRRQYWGAKLLDALQEYFKGKNIETQRAFLFPNERTQMTFLHNLSWQPDVYVLTPREKLEFKKFVQEIKAELHKRLFEQKLGKKDTKDSELVIPRDVL